MAASPLAAAKCSSGRRAASSSRGAASGSGKAGAWGGTAAASISRSSTSAASTSFESTASCKAVKPAALRRRRRPATSQSGSAAPHACRTSATSAAEWAETTGQRCSLAIVRPSEESTSVGRSPPACQAASKCARISAISRSWPAAWPCCLSRIVLSIFQRKRVFAAKCSTVQRPKCWFGTKALGWGTRAAHACAEARWPTAPRRPYCSATCRALRPYSSRAATLAPATTSWPTTRANCAWAGGRPWAVAAEVAFGWWLASCQPSSAKSSGVRLCCCSSPASISWFTLEPASISRLHSSGEPL
mmetsp:Transcript_13574/g.53814  ORF Transcript_13574/g.53814 Transcript_13574/m.53814 type:complete len:303 (-) Transcript_13574:231-1139(-)